jgi:DNA-directed RNA polymerase specialized sigma24 family protein
VPQKQKWRLTQEAFDGLLGVLHDDRERAAERYERLRAKLIKFFEWERCESPEDCADETINRVAKRVSEGERLGNADGYFYGVARMLASESGLVARRKARVAEELAREGAAEEDPETTAALECLEGCLRGMPQEQSDFILEYYQGDQRMRIETRRRMALRLQLPVNAVRNRALRLREKMEGCVRQCLGKKKVT